MCNCMTRINDKLKDRNTRLSIAFCLSRDLGAADETLMIQTEKLDKKSRGKPMPVLPTFCPFCGVKYPRKDDSAEARNAVPAPPAPTSVEKGGVPRW